MVLAAPCQSPLRAASERQFRAHPGDTRAHDGDRPPIRRAVQLGQGLRFIRIEEVVEVEEQPDSRGSEEPGSHD